MRHAGNRSRREGMLAGSGEVASEGLLRHEQ